MPRRFGGPTKARPARPRLRGAACRRPRRLPRRDRRVVPRAPQGRSGRRQMRLAAMPAAELQETGRIPPNAPHSMPEDGCRPCSGLDPPMMKKVGAPCRRHPEKKDRLTCARGPQPKGRKDATREGQDGGSRRRRDNWTTASDGTYPASVAENSMPEEARPRGSPKKVSVRA